MATYFLRRILLMIPTFLGSTVLVFTILQLAPGGPLEQTILQLQMGGMTGGGEGGVTSTDMMGGSAFLHQLSKTSNDFTDLINPFTSAILFG